MIIVDPLLGGAEPVEIAGVGGRPQRRRVDEIC
jgi:hypothetical protein